MTESNPLTEESDTEESDFITGLANKLGIHPSTCQIKGCGNGDAELVKVLPLDPIDHTARRIPLCPKHQAWARQRNEFAEEMADQLREYRKELGQEHIERVQELAMPQDGTFREDILMGETEELEIPLSDAFEEGEPNIEESVTEDTQ